MARRRNINVRTGGNSKKEQIAQARKVINQKFSDLISPERLDEFMEFIIASPLGTGDLQSIAKQWGAGSTEAVPAQLHHNEHAVDALMRNQFATTGFSDSADQPNFAIRHRGAAELMIRRMSIGDTILLRAAHNVSSLFHHDEKPATQIDDYWQRIWNYVLMDLMSNDTDDPKVYEMLSTPMQAAAVALDFAVDRDSEGTSGQLMGMFMRNGPFDFGVRARRERVRDADDGFSTAWVFYEIPSDDVLYEMAVNVTLWGIDRAYLRGHVEGTPVRADRIFSQSVYRSRSLPGYMDAQSMGMPNDDFSFDSVDTEIRDHLIEDAYRGLSEATGIEQALPPRVERIDDDIPPPPEPSYEHQETKEPAAPSVDPRRLLP